MFHVRPKELSAQMTGSDRGHCLPGLWEPSLVLRLYSLFFFHQRDCVVGLVVASATAEQRVLGSIPGSDKVLLGFSSRDFSITVTESGFVPG